MTYPEKMSHSARWLEWAANNPELFKDYHKECLTSGDFNFFEFNAVPVFLNAAVHRDMQYQSQMLSEIISSIAAMCILSKLDLDEKPLFDWLDIPNHVVYWIKRFHNPARRFLWGRPDFHVVNGRAVCLELNIAAAAGYQMQAGLIANFFEDHPAYAAMYGEDKAFVLDPLEGFIAMLGREVRVGESILFADVRESDRYASVVGAPYAGMTRLIRSLCDLRVNGGFIEELDLRKDGVYQSGQRVDKVFLSYYNPHDFNRFADFLPLWHLHESGVVQCMDSLDEILLSNKILFAFASEFVDSLPLSSALKQFVHACVPWTRIVRDAKTSFHGETFDMWNLAVNQKNLLVLKKAQSAEGKDVYIGRTVSQQRWQQLLEHAFSSGGWVLQEFAASEELSLKLWKSEIDQNGQVIETLEDRGRAVTTVSPYLAHGVTVGYCVRHYQKQQEIDTPCEGSGAVTDLALKPFGGVIVVPE